MNRSGLPRPRSCHDTVRHGSHARAALRRTETSASNYYHSTPSMSGMPNTPCIPTQPTCDVITITYNAAAFLQGYLDAITAVRGVTTVRILDNASTDGTAAILHRHSSGASRVHVAQSENNLGFSRACNLVAASSSADILAFVNPDVFIHDPELLTDCINALLEDHTRGVVGCSLVRLDGTLDHAARRGEPTLWNAACYFLGLASRFPSVQLLNGYSPTEPPVSSVSEVDAVNGAFMICRRADFMELGGFDEHFWMYGEDLDLCRRFRESGRRVIFKSDVSAVHLKGAANGGRRPPVAQRAFFESMAIYYVKHHPNARVRSWLISTLIQWRLHSLRLQPPSATESTAIGSS